MIFSYNSKLSAAALGALASLTISSPVHAQTRAADTLVLTEVSDSTLTYSLNGGATTSVNSASGDDWLFAIPLVVTSPDAPSGYGSYIADWQEPDGSGNYNYVGYNAPGAGGDVTIDVFSDYGYNGGGTIPVNANGATYDYSAPQLVGSLPIDVTFNDDGDTATVPDGGSAAGFLALGVTALGILKRARVA